MNTRVLLTELKNLKVSLSLKEGNLNVNAPEGVLTEELIAKLKECKGEIVDFLKSVERSKFQHIPVSKNRSVSPLSHAQKRLWVSHQLDESTTIFNMPMSFWLQGHLKMDLLIKAFDTLVERHEILRTVFGQEDGEPFQRIRSTDFRNFSFKYIDLRETSNAKEVAEDEVKTLAAIPFDLEEGPLFRVYLMQTGEKSHLLCLCLHHIIADEWSMRVLIDELATLYNAYAKGLENPLPNLAIQYKDYIEWQDKKLTDEQLVVHRNYWLDQLKGELPILNFPEDFSRPPVQTHRGSNLHFNFSEQETEAFSSLMQENDASLFIGLMAMVSFLLHRYTGQEDMIIGTPVAGRQHLDLEVQLGIFINMLAIRLKPNRSQAFLTFLEEVKHTVLEGYRHQDYPFDVLVNELNLPRETSRSPLFDVMVLLEKQDAKQIANSLQSVDIEEYVVELDNAKYDLTFHFTETPSGLSLRLEYNAELYSCLRMDRMGQHLKVLLKEIVDNPVQSASSINLLSRREEQRILHEFNKNTPSFISDATFTELFERQVEEEGSVTAVVCENNKLTFFELNERANQLAHYLRKNYQVVSNQLVGILQDRSEWMLISILGILKAGGAYLPIDPDYPEERIAYLLQDGQVKVLLTNGETLNEHNVEQINVSKEWDQIKKESTLNPDLDRSNQDLAYVIYTSGSTGTPKGVMIRHESLVNYLSWTNDYYFSDQKGFPFGCFTSTSFDLTITSLFSGLLRRDTLYLQKSNDILTCLNWAFQSEEIKAVKLTPSHVQVLSEMDITSTPVNTVILGGEKVSPIHEQVLRALNPKMRIFNEYGPTESTVGCSVAEVLSDAPITIGQPIWNTRIFILDDAQQLVPIGIPGEIYVEGTGLAEGYWRNPELTSEKFVDHPFEDGKLYKTGDLGRWTEAGTIEYLGRADDQLKIRGYRIEPGEIETVLRSYPGISEAVTSVVLKGDEKYLAAYFTSEETLEIAAIRSYVQSKLPTYLVPTYFVEVDQFQLTHNGKIDKKALPTDHLVVTRTYAAPRNTTEIRVIDIWNVILGLENIGINDNFFEIGGHSLKAVQVVAQIHKVFSIKIDLKDIFANPVLKDLASRITEAQHAHFEPIRKVGDQGSYVLSHAQRRLWLQEEQREGLLTYNIFNSYRLHGDLDREALEKAFNTLLDRHESLRTVFELIGGEPRQRIMSREEIGFSVGFEDLSAYADAEERSKVHINEMALTPFDLRQGPLLRVELLKLGAQEHLFLFSNHHIISDEWSMQVLVRDVLVLYNAYSKGEANPLATLPIQYKDYAAWQVKELSGEKLESHRQYWLDQFSGELPVLELPSDRPRPPVQSYKGEQLYFKLSGDLSKQLNEFLSDQGSTLFMGLLSLIKTLLYRYTGQSDLIIGTPVAGRDHPDLEDQIGYYLNTLALRTRFSGEDNFLTLLEKVKTVALDGYVHQSYPFDYLIEDLQLGGDISRSPLFDVVMILQNVEVNLGQSVEMEGIVVEEKNEDLEISKGDLRFQFIDRGTHLDGSIEYNTDLYDRERMERMVAHLENLLSAILSDPTKSLLSLEYLSKDEKALSTWFSKTLPKQSQPLVHELIEAQVLNGGDRIAVEQGSEQLSYEELNGQSNQLSALLLDHGVAPGNSVGVLLPAGLSQVSSLLGIFKIGAVYVPLSTSFPADRLALQLEDAQISHVLTNEEGYQLLSEQGWSGQVLVLPESGRTILGGSLDLADEGLIGLNQDQGYVVDLGSETTSRQSFSLSAYSDKNPEITYSPDAKSYIFYTSGSTGKPKGIVGSHEGISHYVQWHAKEWSVDSDFRISQLAPVTFDASLKDILVALISGARLCIPTTQVRENMLLLGQWLSDSQITLLQTVPSVFRMLTKSLGEQSLSLPSLKYVVLAGEKLYGRDIQQWESVQGRDTRISNLYGLTETTVLKSCYHLNSWDWEASTVIPVGTAIQESMIGVMHEGGLCMWGEIGEIYIKSPYVSKGYVDASLNEGLFVQNPLVTDREDYVCRTGDMGRYNSEGLLEVLGRIDDQIKLHGVRVELEEVRGAMLSLSGIEQVELVLHQTEEYQQELICYYTGSERSGEELRRGLSSQIPQYSLPGYYVWLEEFPLNLNGKVDKKALPRPESLLQGSAYEAPQDELERSVSVIWQEVLGLRQPVGRQDSFFNLGGSSLKAIQLISRLYKQHEVQLSIGEIFSNPELSSQAELIRATKRSAYRSISRVAEQEHYALSHAQRRLWVLEQRTEEALPFNGLYQYRLYGKLDRQALARAFDTLLDRHESLRTVFELINGEVRQRVLEREAIGFAVDYEDLSESIDPQGRLEEHLEQLANTAFDLSKGPLLRVKLLRLGREEHAFLFSDHHIISDEWSMQVLFKEVLELYNAYYHGQSNPLTPLAIQYKDYVGWQLEELSGEKLEEHRRYWLDQFSGELPVLELPSDRPRPPVQSHRGDQLYFKLPEELSGSFQAMLSDQGSTLFMGLVALVKTLLYRYTGQSDLIIGTPVAGRNHPDLEDQIGYYLNTLGLRTRFSGSEDYLSLLSQVKQVSLDGFAHQVYPFDYLIEELGLGGDPSRAPLSDVVVILQNIDLSHGEVQELADIRVESVEEKLAISKGDLRFQFSDRGTYLDGSIEYNTDLYDRERMERMVAHLENLLSAILSDPTKSLLSLEYLSKDEKALSTWFSKTLPKQSQTLVHELIEAQVLNGGDRIAVEQGSEQLSYEELNGQSNQLSALLLDHGVELGNSVGVLLPAGLSQVSSLLGIFKIGAVYVPLSTSFPADRLAQQLEDAQISHVLTNEEGYQLLSEQNWSGQVLVLPESGRTILGGSLGLADEGLIGLEQDQGYVVDLGSENTSRQSFSLSAYSDKNPEITYSPDAKSYIFYTSGSTGRAKGIVGSHEGISHYVQWHAKEWSVDSDFRISQLAPVTFDASLKDILVALTSGARLCIPTPQIRENMLLLGQWMRDSQITLLQTVPSVFRMLTKSLGEQSLSLPSLKYVVLAGEKLYGRDIQQWESVQGRDTRISNLYGLTETTVLKSCYHLNSWDWEASTVIPVGTAIQESMIGVMHEGGLCMWGEIGEIYIKSPYVSKGYVDASLNQGLFVQNPLVTDREDYVCRTGDMGRYNSEGLLEVLGRIDDQIKLHGVRVELEEVRGAMLSLSGIEQVELVLHQTEEYQQELICYYTGSERSGEELRRGLSSQIPQYSLPGYYVWLEEFPLNLNGKVDKKALPRPESLLQGSAYEAPQDELERSVSVIWQEVLGLRQPVGRQDSFFNLGGSSLKAIQLISRLYKQHEVQLSIGEIFSNPELSSQAELIRATKRSAYRSISRVAEQEHYALSHAQRRLWVLEQRTEEALPFNGLYQYRLYGKLDRQALARAFDTLLDRHESLRTVFELINGEVRQRVLERKAIGFAVDYEDLSESTDPQGRLEEHLEQLATTAFDLSKGPLLRVKLLRLGREEHAFLFSDHHIISDEWSMQVLFKEVLELYNAYYHGQSNPLTPLAIQYKDYVGWQLEELSGEKLEEHRRYWLDQFSGELPVLELPSDRPRPPVQSHRGDQLYFKLPEELSGSFQAMLSDQGSTLFMGLVALVKTLLYRYTGQSDLIIGTPVAGRDHPDLEDQIGYYLNTLGLRTRFSGSEDYLSLLSQVKQVSLDGFAHQVYPFDYLIEELGLGGDPSRAPLFDVAVILQNVQKENPDEMTMAGVEVEQIREELKISKGDLRFQFVDRGTHLEGTIEYNTDIYNTERIEHMAVHIEKLLASILQNPTLKIRKHNYLSETQSTKISEKATLFTQAFRG